MASRVFLFEDATVLPEWEMTEKVKCAAWFESQSNGSVSYHGFVELISPQKVSYCMKLFRAKWQKCDRSIKTNYTSMPNHRVYYSDNKILPSIAPRQSEVHDDLRKQVKDLQVQLTDLQTRVQNQPTTINQTINNNNTIIIQAFGTEGYKHLSDAYIGQCVRKAGLGVVDLIQGVHYHPKYPNLCNIRAKSLKHVTDNGLLETFNGQSWTFVNRDTLLQKLFRDKCEILDGHFCEHEDQIKAMVGLNRYKTIEAWFEKARNMDKTIIKSVTRDILIMILNKTIPSYPYPTSYPQLQITSS